MELVTNKQLSFIREIEDFCGNKFKGTTKIEAKAYISKNIEEYKLLSMNNYTLKNGEF